MSAVPAPPARWSRAGAMAAIAAVVALTAGCGAGQVSQTAVQGSHSNGAGGRVGEMTVRDVTFLFDGPPAGDEVYPAGSTVPIEATIVNTGDTQDRLVRLSSPVAATGQIPGGAMTIDAGQTVTAGQTGPVASTEAPYAREGGPLTLTGTTGPIRSGLTYPVSFAFEKAGELVLQVPVAVPDVPRGGQEDRTVQPTG